MLFYSSPQVVVQEVKGELSLALSISGCPLRCKGCHSAETRDPEFGDKLTVERLRELINKHKHITCVLFYGGEWNTPYLKELIKVVKEYNLKVCLYTGLELDEVDASLLELLDFIKVGRYIEKYGGLDSPSTNQVFITLKDMNDNYT